MLLVLRVIQRVIDGELEMKLAYIFCLFLIASPWGAVASEPIFKFERIHQISPDEIWHSNLKPIRGGSASILYLDFDRESAERNHGWIAQGIILGGLGDLDSSPIVVRLWSRKPAHLNAEISRSLSVKNGAAVAIFDLDGSICAPNGGCTSTRFLFSVSNDGNVYANGKLVGSAE